MRERHRYVAAARRVIGMVAVVALASGALVTEGAVTGAVPAAGALPSGARHCAAVVVRSRVTVKIELVKAAGGKVPSVAVCIDGKGPYRFLVDTGAGSSVVSPKLARALHLTRGAKTAVRGVTCVKAAATTTVTNWSMSGARLASQRLSIARVPKVGARHRFEGMIGSDVLARFGAVRIDYRTKRLAMAASEHAEPTGNSYVIGRAKGRPPSALVKGKLEGGSPLRVFQTPEGTIAAVPVKVRGHAEQLSVDSGSPGSGLLPAVAHELGLKKDGAKVAYSGIGCKGRGRTFSSGTWALGRDRLHHAPLVARRIAGSVNSGLQGVLGSNVLAAHGAVIVDYANAHLWLTTG